MKSKTGLLSVVSKTKSLEKIRHRASVHEVGVWCSFAGSSYWNSPPKCPLEKWQSHCSEKVNEIDFSKGVPKSRNAKFAPRCSEIAVFAENVRFLLGGEPLRRSSGVVPGGPLKSSKFRYFSNAFRIGFGRPSGRQNVARGGPRSRKGPPNAHFGVSPGRLLMPK